MGAVRCRQPSGMGLLTTARRMVRRGDSGHRGFTRRQPSLPVMSLQYSPVRAAAPLRAGGRRLPEVSDR